jgi:hypothetical protein
MIVTTKSTTLFQIENAIIDIAMNSIDSAIHFLYNHSPSQNDLNVISGTIEAIEIIISQLTFQK